MTSWQQRLLPLALGLALTNTPAWAQTTHQSAPAEAEVQTPADTDSSLSPEAKKTRAQVEEKLRLNQVTQDANAFSGMVASELALLDGNGRGALGAYVVLFERTGRPEMAERAMQIAINEGGFNEAQIILDRWRKIEPIATPLQRQLAWELAAARGDAAEALKTLDKVLPVATEVQAKRMFLLLSQLSISDKAVAKQGFEIISDAAKRHAKMPEAAVAEALYAALSEHKRESISALNRLAALDEDISPATQLVLGVLSERAPEVISEFFAQPQVNHWSAAWRELQIDALVRTENYDQALKLLQQQLQQQPSAHLAIQAGIVAMKQEDFTRAKRWLAQAHQMGLVEERSRAATLLAVMAYGQKQTQEGEKWALAIESKDFAFDQAIILATAAAEAKNWASVRTHLDAAQKATPAEQGLYSERQYQTLELMWIQAQENPQQAYAYYTKWIDTQLATGRPDMALLADLYTERGILLVDKLGRVDEALLDLAKPLQLRPEDPNAMNALGYTMLSKEALREQGFLLVERAFKLSPQSPHINDSLGWAYFLKGQPEKALVYLKFAYDKHPDAEVAAHLVDAYHALGDLDNARAYAQKGWQLNSEHAVLVETLTRLKLLPVAKGQP